MGHVLTVGDVRAEMGFIIRYVSCQGRCIAAALEHAVAGMGVATAGSDHDAPESRAFLHAPVL